MTASVGVNSMTICRYAEGSRDAARHLPRAATRARSAACAIINVQGLPLLKPPYGTIAAFDLTKGEVLVGDPERRDAGQRSAIIRRCRASSSAARAAQGNRPARSRRRRC